jgi:hypothetical protein
MKELTFKILECEYSKKDFVERLERKESYEIWGDDYFVQDYNSYVISIKNSEDVEELLHYVLMYFQVFNTEYTIVSDAFSVGLDYIAIKEHGKYGLVDKDFKKVLECKYDEVFEEFVDGMLILVKDRKFGYFNRDENLVLSCNYEKCDEFRNGSAKVKKGSRDFRINKKGEEI